MAGAHRHYAVVLFCVERIEPELFPFVWKLEVGDDPALLEPFVDESEETGPRCSGRVDVPREPGIHERLLLLGVTSVIPSLRLEMSNSARRRHAVLADHDRHLAVMRDELAQIPEIVAWTLWRACAQVSRVDHHELRVVWVGVVRGEHAGGERACRAHLERVESDGIVVVFLRFLHDLLAARTQQPDFLGHARLRRMSQGIERGPIRVRNGPLRVVAVHLERHHVITLLGEPGLERIPIADRDVLAGVARLAWVEGVVSHHRVRLPLPAGDVAERPR